MPTNLPLQDQLRVHQPHLLSLGRRLSRNEAEAEDLVQETMLRAFVHAASFTPGTNARAWLGRILRNVFIDRRRKDAANRRMETLLANEPLPRLAHDPGVALDSARTNHRVGRALAELPEPFRAAIELVDLAEEDYASAARAMGCPEGTVMSRVHRGRKRLAQSLAASMRDEIAMVA